MNALALELQKEKNKPKASRPMLNMQCNHNDRKAPVTNLSNNKARTVEFKVPTMNAPATSAEGKGQ